MAELSPSSGSSCLQNVDLTAYVTKGTYLSMHDSLKTCASNSPWQVCISSDAMIPVQVQWMCGTQIKYELLKDLY